MTLVLTIIALTYMLFVVIYHIVHFCRADRAGKYAQLKNFRKGTFGLIYLGAIPLYLAGNLFIESNIFKAVFDSFSNALSLVALSFKWSVIAPLAQESLFYKIAVYLCFAAAICNTSMFTFSLLARRLRNRHLLSRITKGERALCIIVGFNERTKQLISSLDRKEYDLLLLAPESEGLKELAFLHDCAILSFSYSDDILPVLKRYSSHTDQRKVRIIVNTENEENNFLLATAIAEYAASLGLRHFSLDGHCGFSAYVFGSDESESSYVRLSEMTHGCVQCINRHRMLALDFVNRHPITERLRPDDINFASATVKPDVTLNFIMIGFGRLSRHILRTHSINSQLLQLQNEIPVPKTINYCIYDIKEAEKDKNLNHNLLRYATWYRQSPRGKEYPVPQSVFDIGYRHMDIADNKFYEYLLADLTNVHGSIDPDKDTPATEAQLAGLRNSIVISCDTDLINIDFAEKLLEKLREWGLNDHTQIYVRIRDDTIRNKVINTTYPGGEIIPFGAESETASSAPGIFAEGVESMAKQQHLNYTKTDNPEKNMQELERLAMETWYDRWTHVQRESNIYACLSVRVKLHLLGFDAAPIDDPRPDASESFREKYFQGVVREDSLPRIYTAEELSDYTVRRHMITRLEHQRWNAYMIACGYVPAEPEEYLQKSKQELHSVRKHANLVTFEELIHQREVLAAHRGCSVEETDVIRYDYRLTDFLPELLAECKLKIVVREK